MGGGLHTRQQLESGHTQLQKARKEGDTSLPFTHTHTPTPSFLGAGRAGAALTQEVREPGGQRSHNFEPFKPSRPRRPVGWQRLPFPPRPPCALTPPATPPAAPRAHLGAGAPPAHTSP